MACSGESYRAESQEASYPDEAASVHALLELWGLTQRTFEQGLLELSVDQVLLRSLRVPVLILSQDYPPRAL